MPRPKINPIVESTVKPTIEPTMSDTIMDILPEIIVMNKPLHNIEDDVDMMSDKMPGRYILQYNTYNSKHLVSVYWDGVKLSF